MGLPIRETCSVPHNDDVLHLESGWARREKVKDRSYPTVALHSSGRQTGHDRTLEICHPQRCVWFNIGDGAKLPTPETCSTQYKDDVTELESGWLRGGIVKMTAVAATGYHSAPWPKHEPLPATTSLPYSYFRAGGQSRTGGVGQPFWAQRSARSRCIRAVWVFF